jgi:hypothetical protein
MESSPVGINLPVERESVLLPAMTLLVIFFSWQTRS